MDRLLSMRVFVQVVHSGSFAGAAKSLKVSPASVTQQVQALEDHLGVQLLNRTTRKLNLTEVGRNFYEHSSKILLQVEEAERCASALQTTPRGLLRVNTAETFARVLAPLIAEFCAANAEVAFEVVTSDHMGDLVESGFDLALRPGRLPDSTLMSRRLGFGRLIVCAAPAYLERRGTPRAPQDLTGHNCLVYPTLEHDWRFTGPDGVSAVDVGGNLRSNSWVLLRRAALAGQGIAMLPAILAADDVRDGHLTRLLPEHDLGEIMIQVVYPPSRHLSLKLRSFVDFLVQRLHEQPVLLGSLPPTDAEAAA
jgi:DNA-binding transcriptional LysR family regulator